MRLAHLILAHNKPQMLERLVLRLHHADSDIYIQLDKKSNIDDFKHIEHIENVFIINHRIQTQWGNYSLVNATLTGFNHILQIGIAYSHINLLSGQDYPLKPIEHIHQFLFANQDKTFMQYLSISDNEWEDGRLRVIQYSLGDYKFPGRYPLQGKINSIFPDRKVPYGMKAFGRSQWLTITPECLKYVMNDYKNKPKLKRFFRLTWGVDEIFFQTMLCNSPLKNKLVNDNLRYIDMYGGKRPTIFTITHANDLIESGKLFARKFDDDVDTEILDYLDKVIGYGTTEKVTSKKLL